MSTSAEPNTETSSAVWDSPAPFATAHATHFVRELKTSTTALGDEEDDSVLWRGEIAEEFLTGIGGYDLARGGSKAGPARVLQRVDHYGSIID